MQFRNLFILAIAAGMAIVYPVHVIVDHTGLFDHHIHHHHHDDDQPSSDPESDEDLCAFCIKIGSMEVSEGQNSVPKKSKITENVHGNLITDNVQNDGKPTRAPPVYF
ncbi:hypothetical protein [Rhodohalobacter sp. SW132]|uniref:hypothetical protein n=1 Tax=Rhodohalobacter sp. SW132 TaxID=2293433 RepID=UPI0011C062E8|nr:hypothetical protein [Rhodohalobacter sp. SW132]